MKIFLDLDGVLADFHASALAITGMTQADIDRTEAGPGRWSWWKHRMTDTEFWAQIDARADFWPGLALTADAAAILQACESIAGPNVYLLTSPPLNPVACTGKVQWVRDKLPSYYRKLFIGSHKPAFAHGGAVLVDDYDGNVDGFRAAGGRAVLVPRQWNTAHHLAGEAAGVVHATLKRLKEQL